MDPESASRAAKHTDAVSAWDTLIGFDDSGKDTNFDIGTTGRENGYRVGQSYLRRWFEICFDRSALTRLAGGGVGSGLPPSRTDAAVSLAIARSARRDCGLGETREPQPYRRLQGARWPRLLA